MDAYQQFIHKSRYARYLPDEQRRETWHETVNRYVEFFQHQPTSEKAMTDGVSKRIYDAILNMDVMPSMRCLMTAGEALERDHVAGYNCSYLPIDHPRALDELMYILLCGTGVGFSVEKHYVEKLPVIAKDFFPTDTCIVVPDSKIGWAKAYKQLLALLWTGEVPSWDVSRLRPAGAPLKTFGGRSSGPDPLIELFTYTTEVFRGASGRQLTTLEAHDLVCKIASVIVVGGVRRSALISLSNPSDERLRLAKSGAGYPAHRGLANNSAAYDTKPDFDFFYREMGALYESYSGERGIFSRQAAKVVAGRNGRREVDHEFGTNPCSEIILRPNQFCNLSEVVVRSEDTLATLLEKVEVAAILGTLQATLTDFRYLRSVWKKNTEDEALLGVSLTGIMDRRGWTAEEFRALKERAVETNRVWAERLGIKQATAVTCVKPSGTVSQLTDSASGMHTRHSKYYIRTVRQDEKDPLSAHLIAQGVPVERQYDAPSNLVFSFPIKSPKGAVTETAAIEQLEFWKTLQEHWCEHKPSCTVYYTQEEFFDVCKWLWENFDLVSGISLLPRDDHVYQQAPYQTITYDEYRAAVKAFPEITMEFVEDYDSTTSSQTLACVGGSCEL